MKNGNTFANAAPLGLLSFGMTTVIFNLHNAGLFELGAIVLTMGLLYGGLAQIIAGVMEWERGNTFGATAFTSYGFFWLSLCVIIISTGKGWIETASNNSMIAYFLIWAVFTLFMFIGTFKISKALKFVFGSLFLLFLLLAAANITGIQILKVIAGYEGVICGLWAMYTGMAEVLDEVYGKKIMPL